MLKLLKELYDEMKSFFLIPVIIFLGISLYMVYTNREIHRKYNGIEFLNGHTETSKTISLEVDGKYTTTLLGGVDEFNGTIKVADEVFEFKDLTLNFNKDGMALLQHYYPHDSNKTGGHGTIFVDRLFKSVSIMVDEDIGNGVYQSNGWIISAPATSRDDAVRIARKLIQRFIKWYKVN